MLPAQDEHRMTRAIPKRIIQTDKTANLPPVARAAVAGMRSLNPDFEYLFFDDTQVEDFINMRFPEYRHVFDSFPIRIQRYDFFRYLAIYQFGGFYFDVDVLLSSSLADLLDCGCVFSFERLTWSNVLREEYGMDWEVGNYAFGARPGHPFLHAIIENCIRAQTDGEWRDVIMRRLPRILREELFVIYTTGPGLVSRTLAEYVNPANPVSVLFPEDVCERSSWNQFGRYGVHLMQSSWRTRPGILRGRLVKYLERRNERHAIELARRIGPKRSLQVELARVGRS
jgi:inositol phosphorylceramide mannosyltransferase catalytic subunit